MSTVNLLPPEVLQRIKTRRLTILIAGVGAVIVGLLIFFWAIQGAKVDELDLQIQAQNAANGELQGQITDLSDSETLQTDVETSETVVATALQGEISWWSQLHDVQLVIPDSVGLESLRGTSTGAGASPSGGFVLTGSMDFTGNAGAPTGAERVAGWLGRSNSIVGWANPWLAQMQEVGEYTGYYTFTSTVDLTQDALTARGQGPVAAAPVATTPVAPA